jgi:hypothetical protein
VITFEERLVKETIVRTPEEIREQNPVVGPTAAWYDWVLERLEIFI